MWKKQTRAFYRNRAIIARYSLEKLDNRRIRANISLEGENLSNDSQSLAVYNDDYKTHSIAFIRSIMNMLLGTELGTAMLDSLVTDFGGKWLTLPETVVFT